MSTSIIYLRSFLGLLPLFRRFIRKFSHVSGPLTYMAHEGNGMRNCNHHYRHYFCELKLILCSAPVMLPPDWTRHFKCQVDAFNRTVGALSQLHHGGQDCADEHFSKLLSPAEENYTANDSELLGFIYFLKPFHCYLEGS